MTTVEARLAAEGIPTTTSNDYKLLEWRIAMMQQARQPYRKGDRVVIPKGTIIKSTYPGWPPAGKPAGRKYEVTVHRCTSATGLEAQVHWVGSGGYWKWCSTDGVELVPSDLEKLAKALDR